MRNKQQNLEYFDDIPHAYFVRYLYYLWKALFTSIAYTAAHYHAFSCYKAFNKIFFKNHTICFPTQNIVWELNSKKDQYLLVTEQILHYFLTLCSGA